MANASMAVEALRNIGPTIAARLREVGIETAGELRSVGAAGAYLRMRSACPGATIPVCYYLYSLAGALSDEHWRCLPSAVKQQLLARIRQSGEPHRSPRTTSRTAAGLRSKRSPATRKD
jgi:DNA transformation protein